MNTKIEKKFNCKIEEEKNYLKTPVVSKVENSMFLEKHPIWYIGLMFNIGSQSPQLFFWKLIFDKTGEKQLSIWYFELFNLKKCHHSKSDKE